MKEIETLRIQIGQTEIELNRLRSQVKQIENNCPHNKSSNFWTVTYTPEHHEGYTIPADGKGSDWRPSCEVPAETIDKWRRKCTLCGKIEITDQAEEQIVTNKTPKW